MQQVNLTLVSKKISAPIFSVVERNGRYLVIRKLPGVEPLVIEDCRTEAFAKACCDHYNSRGST